MSIRVKILGSGTSHGVPSIGCRCAVCCSPDPRDRRSRPALAVRWDDTQFVIDTPPDFRHQAIAANLKRVDALLFTHAHADHIFGLDDVRRFNEMQRADMPLYARPNVIETLRTAFRYVFVETQLGGGKPRLELNPITSDQLCIDGHTIEVIPVFHGEVEVIAYRFGSFAYVTDVNRIPPPSLERLRGVDTLILDALRWTPHPTHFSIEEALEVVDELRPRRTFFTHIAHDLGHVATEQRLPPGVRLAYDGLEFEVED